MNKPVDSLETRIWYYCRGILSMALLAPVALPADEAGNPLLMPNRSEAAGQDR